MKGSVEAGTAVLANTILGAGMLGLPFAFASCGFALGPLMLMLFATCSMSALILLSRCADKVGREQFPIFYDVASLAGNKLGLTNVGTVIDCFVAIKCLGVATSYLIVVGDSIPKALESFGVVGMLLNRTVWSLWALCIGGSLACMKDISSLKPFSLIALSCVLCIVFLITLFAFKVFDPCADHILPEDGPCRGKIELVTEPITIIRALPLFVFSYTCHQNIFEIGNDLHRAASDGKFVPDPQGKNPDKIIRIVFQAVGLAFCVYMVLGSAGYYTFGNLVTKNVLVSYPESYVVAVARIAISLVVTACYPLQAHPARKCLTTIVGVARGAQGTLLEDLKNPNTPEGEKLMRWITSFVILFTGCVAIAVHDLGLVLSVVGATGSTMISYIVPGASSFILLEGPQRWVGLALLCIGTPFPHPCPATLSTLFSHLLCPLIACSLHSCARVLHASHASLAVSTSSTPHLSPHRRVRHDARLALPHLFWRRHWPLRGPNVRFTAANSQRPKRTHGPGTQRAIHFRHRHGRQHVDRP